MLSQAKYLTAAGLLEYALQLVLPVYLVRALSVDDFASYRFLGLLLGTATASLLFGMPGSLSYFLPRLAEREKAAYAAQTLLFSLLMGGMAAGFVATTVWAAPSAGALALLPAAHAAVYALLIFQFASMPLDGLPLALGHVRGQALVNATAAVVRVAAVATGAWIGSIEAVCWAMVVFALTRCALLGLYLARHLPLRGLDLRRARLRDQLGYALPFGLAAAFYMLRGQAEQWIAAGMLSAADYAAVSIAAVVTPFVLMLRGSLSRAVVPALNRLAHEQRTPAMLALNGRTNIAATALLVPLIAFVFTFADAIVLTIYTERYAAAAGVMRVICVGLLAYCVEFASLNACFRIGRKVAVFDGLLLLLSIGISITLTHWIGLQGAVAGSALGLYLGAAFGVWLASRQLGLPVSALMNWGVVARYGLAGVAAAALGGAALQWWRADHALWLASLAAAPVFGAAYLLALRVLGLRLRPERGDDTPDVAGHEALV